MLEGDYDDFKTWIYPKEIQEAIKERTITLEELLSLGECESATLQIFAFGFDEVSGTRKMFKSKKYKREDIIIG